MIGGNYSQKTLNDNWTEDRWQPDYPASRVRFTRPYENDLAHAGQQIRVKQNPTWALPDDGFDRYQISKTHEEYHVPLKEPPVLKNKNLFINTETIGEVCDEGARPIRNAPRSGFRAVLPRHSTLHKDEWTTASREQFSATAKEKEDFIARQKAIEERPAGVPGFREKELGDLHLVGENFELCDIPVQRAWMAQEDPGLREYLKAGKKMKPLPEKDNALSLPLGDGAQREIMQSLKARGGKLFRNSTSITRTKAGVDEISIWDDYP